MQGNRPEGVKLLSAALLFLLVFSAVSVLGLAPVARAASANVVQQSDAGTTSFSSTFFEVQLSPVTAGDILVVGLVATGYGGIVFTDSLHSTFTLAATASAGSAGTYASIYYAKLAVSSSDVVDLTVNQVPTPGPSQSADAYVYELSGVSTVGVQTSTGTGSTCSPAPCYDSITTGGVSFAPGSFLLGVAEDPSGASSSPSGLESGYHYSPETSGDDMGFAVYATSGVSSPTSFSFKVQSTGAVQSWAEAGIVFSPLATTSTSVSCSPAPVSPGSSTTCTATVTGSAPTGSVSFASSSGTGSFSPGSCTLSAGTCSVSYSDTAGGSPTITGTYGGDSTNAGGSGTFTLRVTVGFSFLPIPPGAAPEVLSFVTYGGTHITGYRAAMRGSGMVVYNFPGLNETLLDQELAMGNFSMLPDALSFCSTSAGGNAFVRVSGFQDSWWGGPSLNSTEILFGYYTSSLVSAQGWAPEPACAG